MQIITHSNDYAEVFEAIETIEPEVHFVDHLRGFSDGLANTILDTLHEYAVANNKTYTLHLDNPMEQHIKTRYPRFKILYHYPEYMFDSLYNYRIHPALTFNNFLCCFNNYAQVGRQLLVAILDNFGLYNSEYSSKNFSFTQISLDGNLENLLQTDQLFYKKFFLSKSNEDFFQSKNVFGSSPQLSSFIAVMDHKHNIHRLENKITDSFLHLVSESHALTYYPMVTEKFLYSVVTRGLYLAYAQPGWHQQLNDVWGFKSYKKIFNYDFDAIQNPVIRLVELVTMISKFSLLSKHDWHDIYQVESETIEFNYNHYFSKDFKRHLISKVSA